MTTHQEIPQSNVPRKRSSFKLILNTIVFLVVAIALLFLVGQNTDTVDIQFLVWGFSFPLAVGLLAAAVAGLIIGLAISGFATLRKHLS